MDVDVPLKRSEVTVEMPKREMPLSFDLARGLHLGRLA